MKTIERDIVIVGAGPGGTVCAGYMKKMGLEPLLLDKETFPRDKPCGDGQAEFTLKIMDELGWLDGFREIGFDTKGVVITSPTFEKAVIDAPYKDACFCTPRRIFDNYLFRCAQKDGVETKENAWVYDVIWEDGKVVGVRAKIDGEYVDIRSKLVIGADGAHSVVAQKIDMFPDNDNDVFVVGRCYYADVEMEPYPELHYDKECLPGYIWIFPEENGLANVGLGINRNYYNKGEFPELEQMLYDWIERSPFGEKLRGKKQVGEYRGWRIPCGSQAMENVVPGCILIGDAGSMIMPLTGEGMGAAMMTAKMAAEIAKEAVEKNDFTLNVLSEFTRRRDEFYLPKYQSIKKMENAFADADRINEFVYGLNNIPAVKDAFMSAWYGEDYDKMQY